jgi:hypothetical protein
MNEMSRVRAKAIRMDLEKQASETDSLFVKVAYGLYGRDMEDGKVVDLVIAQPPSNIQDIRELAGQYLQAALTRASQDEEMKAAPPVMMAKQMNMMADALRSRIEFMRVQEELKERMAKEMAQGMNPATMAASQFPGQLTPGMAGQQQMPGAPQGPPGAAPQGAPQGPPPLPASPMEAAGGTE